MRYFCEIQLIENEEVPLYFLWSKVFQQVHLALVKTKRENDTVSIGVSFPEYINDNRNNKYSLGGKLRLFFNGSEELEQLELDRHLLRLKDYINISKLSITPNVHKFAVFRRVQFKKTNPERLARRYAKRHNVTYEEALSRYNQMDVEAVIKENKLPFVHFKSASTDQFVKLFIEKQIHATPSEGLFGTFGLSSTTTVPCF